MTHTFTYEDYTCVLGCHLAIVVHTGCKDMNLRYLNRGRPPLESCSACGYHVPEDVYQYFLGMYKLLLSSNVIK